MGASGPLRVNAVKEQDSLRTLSHFLQREKGIRLLDYKDRWLERRLLSRVRVTRCTDVGAYVEYVRQNPEELNRLLDVLSISISSFFRDLEVYNAIAGTVFRTWRSAALSGDRKLFRAWSCACAQGEEPYSLSALWEHWAWEWVPDEARPVHLKITASEMDAQALSRARAAEYHASVLQGLPSFAAGYFERRGDRVTVQSRVRKRVQFVRENVLSPAQRPRADLILCRNFLIFLDRGGRNSMIEVFSRSLLPGGFLVLGRAETIPDSSHSGFTAVDVVHRIYRKVEDGVRHK